jgi:hypothetical protein
LTRDPKNRLFYLAVPPAAYIPLATMLGEAGLGREEEGTSVRIVVEKPFGRDLPTARELDTVLHRYFRERQIFRIDHYMAKETVQNVLLLRFANALFEPVWNRRYIDHIRITAAEDLGIGHRAGFYDQAGVLRDMFQNHMMMLLSLCAMEPPSMFEAELVRDERSKVFRALRPLDSGRLDEQLVLGQYGPGMSGGQPVPGYLQEPGVPGLDHADLCLAEGLSGQLALAGRALPSLLGQTAGGQAHRDRGAVQERARVHVPQDPGRGHPSQPPGHRHPPARGGPPGGADQGPGLHALPAGPVHGVLLRRERGTWAAWTTTPRSCWTASPATRPCSGARTPWSCAGAF